MTFGRPRGGRFLHLGPAACQAATDERADCLRAPYRLLLVTLTLFVALWGCRAPVEVEGDLPVEPFERRLSSLTQGPGGQWYVVASRGQSPGPYLTVEYEGERHLFATRAHRHGERSAKLLPLTRPEPRWLEDAYQDSPTLEFHDDLRHRTVDSTLGKWGGGDARDVRWLGSAPEAAKRAVVLSADINAGGVSLPGRIRGTATIDADGISDVDGDVPRAEGPYLIIPDGAISEATPRILSLLGDSGPKIDLDDGSVEVVEGPEVDGGAALVELAGLHSVEVAVARQGSDLRIGFAPDGGIPEMGRGQRRPAVVESGVVVDGGAGEETIRTVLRAVEDLYRQHPLSAAYRLETIRGLWSVDGNARATKLRHQDLVAAAGYIPWMRAALVDGADGLGPETSLYLAKAYTYPGHWDAVVHYGERAVRFFGEWPPEHGAVGMARARRSMADARRAMGDDDNADELLTRARDDFLRAGDSYRAALTWRTMLMAGVVDDVDAVVRSLQQAGANYAAGHTLLLMAAQAVDEGNHELGSARLRNWTDRFGAEAPSRLMWLSRAVSTRIDWLGGEGIDGRKVARWEVDAGRSRAWEASVIFALTRHEWGAMHEERDLGRLGQLLVEGSRRSYSQLFASDIDRTLAVICTDLVFSSRSPDADVVGRHCNTHVEEMTQTAEGLTSLLEGGYRFIQLGEMEAAREVERLVVESLPGDDAWPAASVEAYLFRAAVAEEQRLVEPPGARGEDEVDEAMQRAFDLLNEYLPEERAPQLLMELGEAFELRGLDRIALGLYGASIDAARSVESDRELFAASVEFARACHRARDWRALAQMDNVKSPLHAVRIDLYRGHALVEIGEVAKGEALLEEAVASIDEFGALQMLAARELAVRLAIERGDIETAQRQLDRARAASAEFPKGVMERRETQGLKAALTVAEVRLRRIDGDIDDARRLADQALEKSLEIKELESSDRLQLRAYEAAIEVAELPAPRRELIEQLGEWTLQWADTASPKVMRDASRLLTGYYLEQGAPERALERIHSIQGEGLGLAMNRRAHHCVIAAAAVYATGEVDQYHLRRCSQGGPYALNLHVQLLASFPNRAPEVVNYRIELARTLAERLPESDPEERRRLHWLAEFATPVEDDDEELRAQFAEKFSFSRAGVDPDNPDEAMDWDREARIEAAAEYVDHLIATGRVGDAEAQLSDAGAAGRWYFADELKADDLWMLLRIRLAARSLQPFAVLDYVDEALADAPPQTEERTATLHYYRAAAHLQLRQRLPALEAIDDAREYAEEGSEMEEMLDALESAVRSDR